MKTPQPTVTDHALLRFIERVRGFNLDRWRSEIRDICRGTENGRIRFQGHIFVIENGRVVTVQPTSANGPNRMLRQKVEAAD